LTDLHFLRSSGCGNLSIFLLIHDDYTSLGLKFSPVFTEYILVMPRSIFKRILVVILALISVAFLASKIEKIPGYELVDLRQFLLEQKVLEFARKYFDQDVIVVSKQAHQLYYCRNGKVVKNEEWNGFTMNFPVRVALANRWYRTPEGEMYIDSKNPHSRYIRFLSFSGPGAYGIHSAATKFSSYLDMKEKEDPNFLFATLKDDTRGCIQVENRVIKYLYSQVDERTPVLVMP
jgi:L,D-transpeptidase catalytic domain